MPADLIKLNYKLFDDVYRMEGNELNGFNTRVGAQLISMNINDVIILLNDQDLSLEVKIYIFNKIMMIDNNVQQNDNNSILNLIDIGCDIFERLIEINDEGQQYGIANQMKDYFKTLFMSLSNTNASIYYQNPAKIATVYDRMCNILGDDNNEELEEKYQAIIMNNNSNQNKVKSSIPPTTFFESKLVESNNISKLNSESKNESKLVESKNESKLVESKNISRLNSESKLVESKLKISDKKTQSTDRDYNREIIMLSKNHNNQGVINLVLLMRQNSVSVRMLTPEVRSEIINAAYWLSREGNDLRVYSSLFTDLIKYGIPSDLRAYNPAFHLLAKYGCDCAELLTKENGIFLPALGYNNNELNLHVNRVHTPTFLKGANYNTGHIPGVSIYLARILFNHHITRNIIRIIITGSNNGDGTILMKVMNELLEANGNYKVTLPDRDDKNMGQISIRWKGRIGDEKRI